MSADLGSDAVLGVDCSVKERRWTRRVTDDRSVLAIAQRLDVPEVIGRVLAGRGVKPDEAAQYLSPTLRELMPDPSSFADMDTATERLADAVIDGEPVGIFGDYDVDGATASSLMRRYLEHVGATVHVHIPDRQVEGYGPNLPALRKLAGRGAAVVVTVDCGTVAHEPLAAARALGVDIIVVDHHLAEPSLPACLALVNPNRIDDRSGQGSLAAVGVAFVVLVGLNRRLRERGLFRRRAEPDLRTWLDLVALGTVCDVVPLIGLNRAFVTQGLKVIARRNNVGLAALGDIAAANGRPGTYHLGFVYGPRINAGGRVGAADLGHRLLMSDDRTEAETLAVRLDQFNAERRAIETAVLDRAFDQLDGSAIGSVIVVAGDDWHPGVIGLVASRVAERHERPAAAISFDGATGRGSARSVPDFDIGAAVTAARQVGILAGGGGHPMAAGFTITRDRLNDFRGFLNDRRGAPIGATDRTLNLDGALAVSGAEPGLLETLERAGPFGAGNPEPRFALPHVRIIRADRVGTDHVRCILAGDGAARLKAIAFRSADQPLGQALLAARTVPVHLAGHLRPDTWQGRNDVQLFIDDMAHVP